MHSRKVRAAFITLGVFAIGSGCSDDGPQGGPRVATFPVTGRVLVDGKPAGNVQVRCHPVGDPAVPISIAAYTDQEGHFSIGTYEGSDGAPEGEYKLSFFWGQTNLMTGQYGGPDKLKGRYKDPSKSEIEFSVKPGEPVDLGTIELSTK